MPNLTPAFNAGASPQPASPNQAEADTARHVNSAADPRYIKSTITAARLIALLSEEPPDAVVVLAKDREGNAHSPLVGLRAAWYAPDSTYSGEVYPLDPEPGEEPYEPQRGRDLYAVVLDPTN
jgi:hypothetical protein